MTLRDTAALVTLAQVLAAAEPRPPDFAETRSESALLSAEKRKYSTRFANRMAICIANGLRSKFKGVLPDQSGKGTESPAQSVRGPKKLDVNFSTPQLGLGFGISLKAVHFAEKAQRGYIHNTKRNDEELRAEASGYHLRQPYAVMVAVLFLPFDSCDDASTTHPSSFGRWVEYLRPLSGRRDAQDSIDRFERVFIALYERDGSAMEFFDVDRPPPRRGRPKAPLTYQGFLDEVELTFIRRNFAEFEWADDNAQEGPQIHDEQPLFEDIETDDSKAE